MRRTSTRSPRARSARRTVSLRSRAGRSRIGGSSLALTPLQSREAAGVALVAAGLLAGIAFLAGGGPGAIDLKSALVALLGLGSPLPVLAAIAAGVYLIWPERPSVKTLDVVAGLAALLGLLGLLALLLDGGGGTGKAVLALATSLVGRAGAFVVLSAALLVGSIVAFHFSPGEVAASLVAAARSAYAERERIEGLVRSRPEPAPAAAVAPERPAPIRQPRLEETAPAVEPEDGWSERFEPVREPAQHPEAPPTTAPIHTLRVVADPVDDAPEIDWKLPPVSLLDSVTARRERIQDEVRRNVKVIEGTLSTFGVEARVVGVNPGPAVTQYELQPAAGVQVKRITGLANDLSLALAASPLRIEAPIPGKSAVGIEVPNRSASLVSLREVVESPAFKSPNLNLALALGNDVSGQGIVGDLTRMPHLLIAGATGQGKSVCLNVLISSLLFQATPDQLRFILIDPKRVELTSFAGLPHLAVPVIVEPHQAASALRWAVAEMDRRYKLLSAEGVRNIQGYNERAAAQHARPLNYLVIVIDELADLMMASGGEIEEVVCRIAQLARAVGIHLVIATQRPSTDIITGLIKANIPSRIAFAVGSQVDSRVILDSPGAEKLLGRGDMLYQPVDAGKPVRIQGAFVSDAELDSVVRFWRAQGEPRFMEEVLDQAQPFDSGGGSRERRLDPLFARAARAVAAEGAASVSLVQRKFNVGYSRAGRIVDMLAENRVIGGYQGSKSREVLMNLPDVDELLERLGLE